MAAARPVVALVNDRSEAAEVIRQSGCGIVVPPAEPQLFAAALARLSDEPALRRAMGDAGRRYVQRHFDKEAVLDSWIAVLSQALGLPDR
jgi:colanic acid biosynthesis glycosyl transferase WcaI